MKPNMWEAGAKIDYYTAEQGLCRLPAGIDQAYESVENFDGGTYEGDRATSYLPETRLIG